MDRRSFFKAVGAAMSLGGMLSVTAGADAVGESSYIVDLHRKRMAHKRDLVAIVTGTRGASESFTRALAAELNDAPGDPVTVDSPERLVESYQSDDPGRAIGYLFASDPKPIRTPMRTLVSMGRIHQKTVVIHQPHLDRPDPFADVWVKAMNDHVAVVHSVEYDPTTDDRLVIPRGYIKIES